MASGSCEPHLKAEHMAAPTNAANVKKALANSEPSTHGTVSDVSLDCRDGGRYRGHSGQTAVRGLNCSVANDPQRTSARIRVAVPRGLFPSWPDCIIDTFGYSFRRGHRRDLVWINELVSS